MPGNLKGVSAQYGLVTRAKRSALTVQERFEVIDVVAGVVLTFVMVVCRPLRMGVEEVPRDAADQALGIGCG
jgi:hypothetical protein